MSTSRITKTLFFSAPAETVWLYLTDKDKLAQWFHPAEENFEEGKAFNCYRIADDGLKVNQVWGKVIRMNKPHQLSHTFCCQPFGDNETTVTWTLEEVAGGTRLTLQHEGIEEATGDAALHMLMAIDKGWDEHFKELRVKAEQ